MSTRQRVERSALGALSLLCGAAFGVLIVGSAGGGHPGSTWLVAGLWGTGLVALLGGFAACRIAEDPADGPGHLASIAHGLRSEWHRGQGRSGRG